MTPEELEASYQELTRLGEKLRATADKGEQGGLQSVMAGVGYILGEVGKMVVECKRQLGEVVDRERNRDRMPNSIRDERAIGFFARLKPEEREQLVRAVESGVPNISIEAFADHISKVTKLVSWSVNDLLQSLGNWYSYLAHRESEEDVNRVISVLLGSYDINPLTAGMLREVDAYNPTSPFVQQLKRLLRCHSTLGISRKAEMLLARNERQFNHASVSTDLRTIFGGNVETAPTHGVVVHNLVLGINDGGMARTIGLALTSSDILNLAEVLNRAWNKEETLRKHGTYKLLPLR